jgi:PAS domain S-box-containing protein
MADIKILLVEDESIEAMEIKRTLKSFGYEVPYVASSGEDAVEKALKIMPDLILMDIVLMGDNDGIEAATQIKELNIPVIFITAHSEESTIERAKHTEPYGIIIKPYNRIELKYAIELAIYKNKIKKELKESEYNLRLILNSAAEGIFGIDLEGLCTFCNTSSLNILGYDNPNELIGKNIHDLIHQYESSILGFKTGKHVHMEDEEFMMADGTIFSVEYWSYPQIKDQKIIGAVVTFTDITERKQAENELLESEEKYRRLFDDDLTGDFIATPQGKIIECNYSFAEIYCFETLEQAKTSKISEFNPKDWAYLIESFKTQQKIYGHQTTHQRPDGVNIHVVANVMGIFNELDQLIQIKGYIFDDTKRKQAENELLESEDFLKNIVENIPNMIFIKSADKLNFEMVNKAGEELMGHSREELIGKTDYDFFPKNEADFFTQKDREVLQNKKLLDIPEETIENKNLGQRILHTKKIPIFNKEGNPQYLLGVSEDITELKQGEIEIKKSLNEKETLLREIHHRVKNNLQIIASLLHLQEATVNDEELANVLKESESRVKSMAIVYDKLYHSPNFNDINFKQYIEKLVYDILYTYGIKKGTIKVQLDIEDITINIDTAIPLGLIINELITNSVKYAFPQKEGNITIQLKSLPEQMELTIGDDGIGMPKDINLENPETLGLQLVQTLVNQLEGELKLNKDNGTDFKIIFKELKYKKRL